MITNGAITKQHKTRLRDRSTLSPRLARHSLIRHGPFHASSHGEALRLNLVNTSSTTSSSRCRPAGQRPGQDRCNVCRTVGGGQDLSIYLMC